MKKNIGFTDQVIRLTIAVAALLLYFGDTIHAPLAFGLFGVMGFTALLSYCPIYQIFKLSTNQNKKT